MLRCAHNFPIAFYRDVCYTEANRAERVRALKKILAFGLVLALLLGGCAQSEPCAQETVFCMDTVMDLRIWGQDRQEALDQIKQLLYELEKTWSSTDENSLISALNRGVGTPTAQQQALLEEAEALSRRTGGAFDPKLRNVVALWGFYEDNHQVPTADEIAAARQEPQWDLGAIVKGYAGREAVAILTQLDVDRAILNLGGNVQTYGEKTDGSPWNVAIQNPQGGDHIGLVAVSGTAAVVTSGDYQRYFESGGVRYHHILDPETGTPAASGLCSVTVICADGAAADALSTALFVMGLEEAADFWRQSDDFEAVFILTSGEIYATEGVSLSDCEYEVIRREK